MHPIVLVQLAARPARNALPQHGAHALDCHQETQRAEQQDVADRDRQLDLALSLEPGEQPDTEYRAGQPAQQQREAHLEIDIAAPPMREHARQRGADQLIGRRGHRDSRRHANKDEQRGQQKAAAHTKHPGQKADRRAEPKQDENIQRDLSNRQVDVHGWDVAAGVVGGITSAPSANGQDSVLPQTLQPEKLTEKRQWLRKDHPLVGEAGPCPLVRDAGAR